MSVPVSKDVVSKEVEPLQELAKEPALKPAEEKPKEPKTKEEIMAAMREKMKVAYLKKKKILEAIREKDNEEAVGKTKLNQKLILAAKKGDLHGKSGVIALIAQGANVEYIELDPVFNTVDVSDYKMEQSCWFGNALMTAAAFGQLEVVRYLLNSEKIKINAKNLYFFTALTFAALNNQEEVVAALLYRKANPNFIFCLERDGNFSFPSNVILLCREFNPSVTIIKMLLESNIPYDVDYPNYHDGNNTALGYILFNTKIAIALKQKIVEVLIKSGANRFTMPSGMKQAEFCNILKAIEKDYPKKDFPELNDIVDNMLTKLGQPRKKLSRDLRTESSRDFEAEPSVSKSLAASLNAIALDADETRALISKTTEHLDSAGDDVAASKDRPSKLLTFMMKKRSSGTGSPASASLPKALASTPTASASKDDKGKGDKDLSALPPIAPAKSAKSLASGKKSTASAVSLPRFI